MKHIETGVHDPVVPEGLEDLRHQYVFWEEGRPEASLDGWFTAEQLRRIAGYMDGK